MSFRTRTLLTAIAVLGVVDAASAQPVAPPRRPTWSTYNNIYSQPTTGYGGYGYGMFGGAYGGGYGGAYGGGYGNGWGNQGFGQNLAQQQQNQQLAQQLNNLNQNLNNLQQSVARGVNPNFPATGHAATFNNLSPWYSNGSGSGGGGVMSGGYTTGRTAGIGIPVGAGANNRGNTGAAVQPRTAGTGMPVGGPRR